MDSNRQQGSRPSAYSGGKNANASNNGSFGGRSGSGSNHQRGNLSGGPRMVVLGGGAKKSRVPAASGGKLAVPKPVNLPSLRKEHGGNDPTTQLVVPGGAQGWSRNEEPQPANIASGAPGAPYPSAGHSSLVSAGHTGPGPAPWQSAGQPGGPPLSDSFAGPNSGAFPPLDAKTARLNASDYPTLSTGTRQTYEFASSKPASLGRQRHDSGRHWQEDERDGRSGTKWRDREDQEDERFVGGSITDDRRGRGHYNDWDDSLELPGMPGFGPSRATGRLGRAPWDAPPPTRVASALIDAAEDQVRAPLPKTQEPVRDLEREAFQAELDRVAAEMELKAKAPPVEEVEEMVSNVQLAPKEHQQVPASEVKPLRPYGGPSGVTAHPDPFNEKPQPATSLPSPGKALPLVSGEPPHPAGAVAAGSAAPPAPVKAAEEKAREEEERLARQESIRRRKLKEEEEERKRKEAAAAKLRALEETIARRKAEDEATEKGPASDSNGLRERSSESSLSLAASETKGSQDLTSPTAPWGGSQQTWQQGHGPGLNSSVEQQQQPAPAMWMGMAEGAQPQEPPPSQKSVEAWAPSGSSSLLGAGLFGPGLLDAPADTADLSQQMSPKSGAVASGPTMTLQDESEQAAVPGKPRGVTSRDAAFTSMGHQGNKKAAIGAPGATGGGKPGSSNNLKLAGESADTHDPSSGMAYGWGGPDLAAEVINSIQRQRTPTIGEGTERPDSRQSVGGNDNPRGEKVKVTGHTAQGGRDVITSDVFADGVSALPSDLALEDPVSADNRQMLGHMPAYQQHPVPGAYVQQQGMPMVTLAPGSQAFHPPAGFGGMPFGGAVAPGRPASPWQQPPPPPPLQQHPQHQAVPPGHPQQQPGEDQNGRMASQGLESFYGAQQAYNKPFVSATPGVSGVPGHHLLMGHLSPFSPFGQFGQATPFGGGQFGQLGASPYGAPGFLPSGKQPDWSNPTGQVGTPGHRQQASMAAPGANYGGQEVLEGVAPGLSMLPTSLDGSMMAAGRINMGQLGFAQPMLQQQQQQQQQPMHQQHQQLHHQQQQHQHHQQQQQQFQMMQHHQQQQMQMQMQQDATAGLPDDVLSDSSRASSGNFSSDSGSGRGGRGGRGRSGRGAGRGNLAPRGGRGNKHSRGRGGGPPRVEDVASS